MRVTRYSLLTPSRSFSLDSCSTHASLFLPKDAPRSASELCAKVFAKSVTRGASLDALAGAVVYAVCRQQSLGLTVEEVAAASGARRGEVVRLFRRLQRKLRLPMPSPAVEEYLPRLFASLRPSSNQDLVQAARSLAQKAQESQMAQGRNPSALAAACIYITALERGEWVSQRRLAQLAFVAEATIRSACFLLKAIIQS